jgi:hypothetical protein
MVDKEVKKSVEPSKETNDPSELSDEVLDAATGGANVGEITVTKYHDTSNP